MTTDRTAGPQGKPLGFWACWSLTVGIMIGSGVFTLPAVLAQHGLISFGGWLITGGGSILLALAFARLSARTPKSGGPYTYTREAFGDLPGFLIAWGYWASYWIAIAAIAIAFVGYAPVFFPDLQSSVLGQIALGLGLIWVLTVVNVIGLRGAGFVQIALTVLKIAPLLLVIALGATYGEAVNLPAFNPQNANPLAALSATALLTMWAFSGLEAGALPAGDVQDAQRTIPRALVIGTLSVLVIYLAATAAVMLLAPADALQASTAPFADAAAAVLGPAGAKFIALGALISTAGALNGCIFIAGQMPMAVALDRLAPSFLARTNAGGAPYAAVILASLLGSVLLIANYTRGLMGAFTFLLMMSTVTVLVALLASCLAEIRHSYARAPGWALLAASAALCCAFSIIGSTLEVMAWGLILIALGLPVFIFGRSRATSAFSTNSKPANGDENAQSQ
jgi:APA family basic amino acid/polyamine antiporter